MARDPGKDHKIPTYRDGETSGGSKNLQEGRAFEDNFRDEREKRLMHLKLSGLEVTFAGRRLEDRAEEDIQYSWQRLQKELRR
ncbi:hypothetical protein AJ80_08865 [Polytolypa hystricis UAMH7299]|uniref:Uncharacterized protein n=1 Tax=Polytolypa hystricis (strain UAMH7299) TaxID=1447883 RepID=A0A2B7X0M6_POLH7|nr:hypothetical protein AJ80_08865 [Polytolypa hystricis UAMH7299]